MPSQLIISDRGKHNICNLHFTWLAFLKPFRPAQARTNDTLYHAGFGAHRPSIH
jgi:hypothetical protein